MDITAIAHSELIEGARKGSRQTVYTVSLPDRKDVTFRVRIKKDPYDNQAWALVEVMGDAGFTSFFDIQDGAEINRLEMWETEDRLVGDIARWLSVPFDHFDSQTALYEGRFITDD